MPHTMAMLSQCDASEMLKYPKSAMKESGRMASMTRSTVKSRKKASCIASCMIGSQDINSLDMSNTCLNIQG